MSSGFGYFLITIGLLLLVVQLGWFDLDLFRQLVKTPYFMPLAFMSAGFLSVLSYFLPVLKPLSSLAGFILVILVMIWVFSGFSNFGFGHVSFSDYYSVENGLSVSFGAGTISVEKFNDSHVRLSGKGDKEPLVSYPGSGLFSVDLGAGEISVSSIPDSIKSVNLELGVGKVEFRTLGDVYNVSYDVSVGRYSMLGDSCVFCKGKTIIEGASKLLTVDLGVGEVEVR